MSLQYLKHFGRGLLGRNSPQVVGGEQPSSHYDGYYAKSAAYNAHYSKSVYYFLWSVIADRIEHSGITSVLEIGCGPGQLASMLLDRGLQSYTGMDFSPKAIEMARKNCPKGRFEVGDALATDLHRQVDHDLIICTEVLEHIENDLQVVSRFRPGVRCICTVPSFAHESHVRLFRDCEEVKSRYGPFFEHLEVSSWISPNYQPDLFFLMDGRRSFKTIN